MRREQPRGADTLRADRRRVQGGYLTDTKLTGAGAGDLSPRSEADRYFAFGRAESGYERGALLARERTFASSCSE